MAGAKELFGLPFLVQCEGDRSFRHLYRRALKQVFRFLSPEARAAALKTIRESGVVNAAESTLPFVVRVVHGQNPLLACGLCRSPTCQGCNLPLDSQNVVGNVVGAPTFSLALDWVDPSAYYDGIISRVVMDPSLREVEERTGVRAGVTLAACLDEYTKEETLEDDIGWRCGRCKALRRGRRQEQVWTLPDILVIHVKRFQASGRWRDKVRTRVDFPLEGLDMSRWLYRGEGRGPDSSSTLQEKGQLYDLFGVINHQGGMTGGHYTASCRSHSVNRNGSTEGLKECGPGVWKVSPTWLSFDDEYVDIIHPEEIVTSSAYVLFYSRKRFRPSNVLNTWSYGI